MSECLNDKLLKEDYTWFQQEILRTVLQSLFVVLDLYWILVIDWGGLTDRFFI